MVNTESIQSLKQLRDRICEFLHRCAEIVSLIDRETTWPLRDAVLDLRLKSRQILNSNSNAEHLVRKRKVEVSLPGPISKVCEGFVEAALSINEALEAIVAQARRDESLLSSKQWWNNQVNWIEPESLHRMADDCRAFFNDLVLTAEYHRPPSDEDFSEPMAKSEVAKKLQISTETLRSWISEGKVTVKDESKKFVRILRSQLPD